MHDSPADKWRNHENMVCVPGLVQTPVWQEAGILIRKLCDIRQEDGWVEFELRSDSHARIRS